MKLSINEQSVEVLRYCAEKMLVVYENLDDDIMTLFNKFNDVHELVGPHKAYFEEMFFNIKKAETVSSESIKELAYMLRCTADKMESYINNSSISSIPISDVSSIEQRYDSEANKRILSSETNPFVKELYDQYSHRIRIVDYEYQGTPFYNTLSKGIKLNAIADLHNSTGNMSTYFHEVGHMIDDYAGVDGVWLSDDCEYHKLLRCDVEAYINQTMLNKKCDKEEAFDFISEEISGDWNAGVSDIFGSLTECKCQGDWGHHISYWKSEPKRIEKEAFANMFEASIGDANKLKAIKKFFPRSYERFEQIIRSR